LYLNTTLQVTLENCYQIQDIQVMYLRVTYEIQVTSKIITSKYIISIINRYKTSNYKMLITWLNNIKKRHIYSKKPKVYSYRLKLQ